MSGVRSIRWLVACAAVVLTALPVIGVGFVSERNSRAALEWEIEARVLLAARNLANTSSRALLSEYPELTLQPIIRATLREQSELAFAVVLDHRGTVQGHPDSRQLGRPFTRPAELVPIARSRPLAPGETLQGNARLLIAEAAVRGPDGHKIGAALVALERAYMERTLAESRGQQAILLGVLVLVAVTVAFVSMSQLLRPIGALRAGLERIGRGDFDTPIRVRDRTELGLLADSMNDVASALKRAQTEMVERERLAHEIELAREIQRSLLPAAPFRAGSVAIRGEQRAATEVGGDYYDILPLVDGRVAVAIADVSGKGLAGCLVTAMLSALLRSLRPFHDSPSGLLAALDERLGESLQPGVFVTMYYAIVEPESGRVTWSAAGHNPALVYRYATGRVERCASRGVPLATTRGGLIRRTLQDQVVDLSPGDLLVQYTDAFTEAFAPVTREPFGLERLEQSLVRYGRDGLEAVIAGLRSDVETWTGGGAPADDETLLVVGRIGDRRESASDRATADVEIPLQRLADAEARGHRLALTRDVDGLRKAIVPWLKTSRPFVLLPADSFETLASVLYEVCANIAEHGYGSDRDGAIEMWWVPGESWTGEEGDPIEVLRAGSFVFRDDGRPFRPEGWKATDFRDQRVWQRRRGLGLEIIHRAMRDVVYAPGTPRGNVTFMRFGPGSRPSAAEAIA